MSARLAAVCAAAIMMERAAQQQQENTKHIHLKGWEGGREPLSSGIITN